MNIKGIGQQGDEEIVFNEKSATAMMGISRGILTFKTSYIWAAFDTVLPNGMRIAVNIQGGQKRTEESLNNEDYAIINGELITFE